MQLNKLVSVDDDAKECRCCGIFKNKNSYPPENMYYYPYCLECLKLSPPEFDNARESLNKLKLFNPSWKDRVVLDVQAYSVSVSELRRYLEELPPDARIVVTQEGYYAEEKFCYIDFPEQPMFTLPDGIPVYVLANSDQSP